MKTQKKARAGLLIRTRLNARRAINYNTFVVTEFVNGFTVICKTFGAGRESPALVPLPDEPPPSPPLVPAEALPPEAAPDGSGKWPVMTTVKVNISEAGALNCSRREVVLSPGANC